MQLTCEMVRLNGQMRARVSAAYSDAEPPYVDCISLDSARSRARFVKMVGDRSDLPPQEIERELLRLAAEQSKQPVLVAAERDDAPVTLSDEQRAEAEEYLRSPTLFKRIADDIDVIGVEGELELSMTIYLVLSSRCLKNPL